MINMFEWSQEMKDNWDHTAILLWMATLSPPFHLIPFAPLSVFILFSFKDVNIKILKSHFWGSGVKAVTMMTKHKNQLSLDGNFPYGQIDKCRGDEFLCKKMAV